MIWNSRAARWMKPERSPQPEPRHRAEEEDTTPRAKHRAEAR